MNGGRGDGALLFFGFILVFVLLFLLGNASLMHHRVAELECQIEHAQQSAEGWYGMEPC